MIEIHAELQRLSGLMHDAGYVPCTKFVLHDVEEEEKLFHLCHHSKKLAIAFGLINTAPEPPLGYGFWEVALVATVCLGWQIKWVKSSLVDPTSTVVVWSSGNH
ncbi:unnamed protein product [Sphagnum troendelagicum]|uniref:DYW domain-containing protein n=1 Tax=Sphagnum troendelagicum TaxID=128251 RepID=A0ABP0TDH4_9BRYO